MSIIRGALAGLGQGLMQAGNLYMQQGIQAKQDERRSQQELDLVQKKAELMEQVQINMQNRAQARVRAAVEGKIDPSLTGPEREGAISKAMMDPSVHAGLGDLDTAVKLKALEEKDDKPVALSPGTKLVDPKTREVIADNHSETWAGAREMQGQIAKQRALASKAKSEKIDLDKIYKGAVEFYKDQEFKNPLTGDEDKVAKQLRVRVASEWQKKVKEKGADVSLVEVDSELEPLLAKYDQISTQAAKAKAEELVKTKDMRGKTVEEIAADLRASDMKPDLFMNWVKEQRKLAQQEAQKPAAQPAQQPAPQPVSQPAPDKTETKRGLFTGVDTFLRKHW